jgi:predicted methyltransferase
MTRTQAITAGWRDGCGVIKEALKQGVRKMRRLKLAAIAICLSQPVIVAAAPPAATSVEAAVAAPDRTPDNVKLDASRKPAQILEFLGLRKGMRVLDLVGSNRYWAEITAPAVGPTGHVDVWDTVQFIDDDARKGFDEFAARQKNVTLTIAPFEKPEFASNRYDLAIFNLNYHDVYWTSEKYKVPTMDPNAWLKTLYSAMKPGGIVGVIDHVANPNTDTRATVDRLHRIDPEVVKADFKRAGFELVAESDLLRNPADDHNLLVFDPKIRGKTDRFVFKFRKPR